MKPRRNRRPGRLVRTNRIASEQPEHDRADRGEDGEVHAVAHRPPPVGIGDEVLEVAQRQRAARLVERRRPQRRPQHRDDRPDDERQREDPQPVLRHRLGQPAPLEPPARAPDIGGARSCVDRRRHLSTRTPRSNAPGSTACCSARSGRVVRRGSRCPHRPLRRSPACPVGQSTPSRYGVKPPSHIAVWPSSDRMKLTSTCAAFGDAAAVVTPTPRAGSVVASGK